jgi:hypothetical protein
MSTIPKVTLEDTLYLIQLIRETALEKGRQAQADRFTAVETQMRGLVSLARKDSSNAPVSGILGQPDFRKLLEISRSHNTMQTTSANSAIERNQVILAMAQANMSDIDIARQFGLTRDEVRLVFNTQQTR